MINSIIMSLNYLGDQVKANVVPQQKVKQYAYNCRIINNFNPHIKKKSGKGFHKDWEHKYPDSLKIAHKNVPLRQIKGVVW